MKNDVVSYFESSFLMKLLNIPNVTDISYNGEKFYYMASDCGRKEADLEVTSKDVGDFLKQIANLSEKSFSLASPILDVSFSKYRLNGVYSNISRTSGDKTFSFSLRIASNKLMIADDSFEKEALEILLKAISDHLPIFIAGSVNSGKTELLKWILSKLKENSRVIVIDNIEELDLLEYPHLDKVTWIVGDKKENSYSALVKNSLRSNPDYIVLAEARGEEFSDALDSLLSGHPVITTLHASSLETMVDRMARLVMLSPKLHKKEEVLEDLLSVPSLLIYMQKEEKEGAIFRQIESIGKVDHLHKKVVTLYKEGKNDA